MRLPFTKALVLVTVAVLGGACSRRPSDPSKQIQPSPSQQNNTSQNDAPMPEAAPVPTPSAFAEASNEADRRIKEVFQECSNGMTYTLSGPQHITEIEGFEYWVEATKEKPDRVDLKNHKTWFGNIIIRSTLSRSYDTLNACWSKYDSGLNTTLPLTQEEGQWLPVSTFPDQKRPTCEDVVRYLSEKKLCR